MIRVSSRSRLRCAYCHADAFGALACLGCRTLVHPACSAEVGRCPTLGCLVRPEAGVERAWASPGWWSVALGMWMEVSVALGLILALLVIGGARMFIKPRAHGGASTRISEEIR